MRQFPPVLAPAAVLVVYRQKFVTRFSAAIAPRAVDCQHPGTRFRIVAATRSAFAGLAKPSATAVFADIVITGKLATATYASHLMAIYSPEKILCASFAGTRMSLPSACDL